MFNGKFKLDNTKYNFFTRSNRPTDEIIKKITRKLSLSGVQTSVCTILARKIWREYDYDEHLHRKQLLRFLFSSGGEHRFLHDLIKDYIEYKRTNDVSVKTDFHVRLLIRQIATTTRRYDCTDFIKEFLRDCPGFNDTIDYQYYIGELHLQNWRAVLKKIAARSSTVSQWIYYTAASDPYQLFDYTTARYAANEVAKAMVSFPIDIHTYDYMRLYELDPDEAKIAKEFFDAVANAIENIKRNFAETSNCAEWRASMQRRVEALERKIDELSV